MPVKPPRLPHPILIAALLIVAGGFLYFGLQTKRLRDHVTNLGQLDQLHDAYYRSNVWLRDTKWLGVRVAKLPLDLFVYQEILYENRPDVVIEAGTLDGGSAYFFASVMDLLTNGKVITIDIADTPNRPKHRRITYLLGSSTSDDILRQVKQLIPANSKVMVVLDSDHSRDHVLNELRLYSSLVTPGQYLIVEDTNVNGHPVYPEHGPGPMEALETFLKESDDFESDASREKFLISFNPRGYLKKVP